MERSAESANFLLHIYLKYKVRNMQLSFSSLSSPGEDGETH